MLGLLTSQGKGQKLDTIDDVALTNQVLGRDQRQKLLNPGASGDDLFEPLSIEDTLDRLAAIAVRKWMFPASYFFQAIAGGAMVGFGVVLAIAVSAGIATPGVANLVSGVVFGFSFVLIMVSQTTLITSDMAAGFVAVTQGVMSIRNYLGFMAVGWIGNILGAFIFIGVIAIGSGPYGTGVFLLRAHAIGVAKTAPDALSVVALGIVCTWFLQTAMFLYFKARTDIGRMILAYYGPFAFVAGMTEHCIANIGFIGFPLLMQARLAKVLGHPLAPNGPLAELTWGFGRYGLLRNEILSGLGNLLGGTVCVVIVFIAIVKLRTPRLISS